MSIIGLILMIVGGIALYWWRARQARDAAESAIDLAGKAKGAVSRARFKHKAGKSILAGVDDPRVAAATLVYGLMALKRPISLSDEDKIDAMLESVCQMGERDRQEAIAFAAWAAGQVADVNEIVRRFLPLWMQKLDKAEREQLVNMAVDACEIGGAPTDAQQASLRRLSGGLLASQN